MWLLYNEADLRNGGAQVEGSVFFAACEQYEAQRMQQAVSRILSHYGGAAAFLQQGKRVVIKPNLLMARAPAQATTTHPLLVETVARTFVQAGADVTIADSPGGPFREATLGRVYDLCGMTEAARGSGAVLNRDLSAVTVQYDGRREFEVMRVLAEADVIIDLAKLKTHRMTYFTGAAKNMFGSIPGLGKAAMHSKLPGTEAFCNMLVDLCMCMKPALSIIDAVDGMEGKGPSGGTVRHGGALIASRNPFAADLAAMEFAGLDSRRSPVHTYAAARQLVPRHASELERCGDMLPPVSPPFAPPVETKSTWSVLEHLPGFIRRPLQEKLAPYPMFSDRCVGCGDCARACPRQAITVENRRAILKKSACIKCYCCHELCPIRAVEIED